MKLQEVKKALESVEKVIFKLPNGKLVPRHFHVTEVGSINKNFIDCGGTLRSESKVSFQLWTSIDIHHRLNAKKLNAIIDLSIEKLGLANDEIEVEYQGETIGKYGLDFDGKYFLLTQKQTDCLAKDNCGIPVEKAKVALSQLAEKADCCTPGSGCC
ncbi:MAG: hypothetical protein JXQ87_11340 [Bacteroidia bacterium]